MDFPFCRFNSVEKKPQKTNESISQNVALRDLRLQNDQDYCFRNKMILYFQLLRDLASYDTTDHFYRATSAVGSLRVVVLRFDRIRSEAAGSFSSPFTYTVDVNVRAINSLSVCLSPFNPISPARRAGTHAAEHSLTYQTWRAVH